MPDSAAVTERKFSIGLSVRFFWEGEGETVMAKSDGWKRGSFNLGKKWERDIKKYRKMKISIQAESWCKKLSLNADGGEISSSMK